MYIVYDGLNSRRGFTVCNSGGLFGPPNVGRLSGGEAPMHAAASGTPLAATNEEVGGRDLQAV